MIARLGGDEFVVLLPQIRSDAQAEEVAHRDPDRAPAAVRRRPHAARGDAGDRHRGRARARHRGLGAPAARRHRDVQREGKRRRRRRGLRRRPATATARAGSRSPAELQTAIADGELEVYYQPKADLAHRRARRRRGARCAGSTPSTARSRPTSSSRSPRAPGLMRAMTALVLDRALEQIARGATSGIDLAGRGEPLGAQPHRPRLRRSARRDVRSAPASTRACSCSRSPRRR